MMIIILTIMVIMLGCNKKKMNALTKVSADKTEISANESNSKNETKNVEKKSEYSYFKTKEQEEREKERKANIVKLTKPEMINKLQPDSLSLKSDEFYEINRKYVVQLSSIKDKARLELEQQNLSKYGYETNISQRNNHGTTYYRLRLNGKFTETEATKLGDEIKNKFLNITDYIVLRVN